MKEELGKQTETQTNLNDNFLIINNNNLKHTIMKTYNYFYNGVAISKAQFLLNVPENWENEIDEYGCYSWGYYSASEIDIE